MFGVLRQNGPAILLQNCDGKGMPTLQVTREVLAKLTHAEAQVPAHAQNDHLVSEMSAPEQRRSPYMNNVLEQDHRYVKKRVVASQ